MVATILVRRIVTHGSGEPGEPAVGGERGVASVHARSVATPAPRRRAARIAHFGGGFEPGTVLAVLRGGRRLEVRSEGGEVLEFVLSPATARFVSASDAHGPRLELLHRAEAGRAPARRGSARRSARAAPRAPTRAPRGLATRKRASSSRWRSIGAPAITQRTARRSNSSSTARCQASSRVQQRAPVPASASRVVARASRA